MTVSVNNIIAHVDTAGRPAMRAFGVLICGIIGICICAAFVNWGFFHIPMPELPGQAIVIGALPYAYQGWDNYIRQSGRNKQLDNAGTYPTTVNPHGGPGAP
jgi:hypothetical protein